MQNGFERHGITHSSASSINLWANAPDVFVAEKLFGFKPPGNAAMHRGNAVEYGLVQALMGIMDKDVAISMAIQQFNSKTALIGGDNTDKEREVIAPMIEQGILALSEFGKPEFEADGKQNKIEILCKTPEFEIPVIGFLDLVFKDHNLVIDVKSTLRIPTEMSVEHNRQCAVYRQASGNAKVQFCYLSPKKFVFHECHDVAGTLAEIKQIIVRQEYLLRQGDKEEIAKLVHYNPNSFYWNGNIDAQKQVFG